MEFIRKNKKSILEILFLVLLVVFTFYALLKDQELDEINQVLKTASLGWLIAALVLLLLEFVVLDRRNPLLAHLNIFREK